MSDNLYKVVVDVQTGGCQRIPLTEAEIAARQKNEEIAIAERQARESRAAKVAAMMAWLEQQYDNRDKRPA